MLGCFQVSQHSKDSIHKFVPLPV